MTKNNQENDRPAPFLNAAIGFLGLLLFILVFSLITRLVYPRIISERSDPDPSLISNVIQIEVLNGCGVSGLATAYTGTLRGYGFDVVETGNFDHFNVEKTIVIARSHQLKNAERVARALGVDEQHILQEVSNDFYLDVTLVLGADYDTLNL